ASEGSEPNESHFRAFAMLQRQALVVHHDPNVTASDDRPQCCEIQRYDINFLRRDVLPDVEFSPIRQRKNAHRLPFTQSRVVEPPQFRTLVPRVPAMLRAAHGEDALLGAAPLLVASRSAECRVKRVAVERLLQRLR